MSETMIIAIISCIGTVSGSFFGILAANKLMSYRIEQLEKKVDKHNHLVERMYDLEEKFAVHEKEFENLVNKEV